MDRLQVLQSNPDFSMLLALIPVMNLTDQMVTVSNFTVLAATNEVCHWKLPLAVNFYKSLS